MSRHDPLAADGPAADIELQEAGPFPLTLKDMFTKTYVVDAHPEMTIREVKELVRVEKELRLVRAEKQRKAEAALAAARESLAQLEAEVARAVGDDAEQLAALEEQEAVAVAEVARLEALRAVVGALHAALPTARLSSTGCAPGWSAGQLHEAAAAAGAIWRGARAELLSPAAPRPPAYHRPVHGAAQSAQQGRR